MSSELKPCPFCGGEAYAVEYVSALKETRIKSVVGLGVIEHKEPYEAVLGVVIVGLAGCSSCRAQVEAFARKNDEPGTAKAAAIEAWNKRAGEAFNGEVMLRGDRVYLAGKGYFTREAR